MPKMSIPEIRAMDREIGARLRTYRLAAHITQSGLGDALSVTFQQIQKYESGRNRISGHRLVLAANLLKVTPGDILGEGAAKNNSESRQQFFVGLSDPFVNRMVRILGKLPPPQRRAMARAATHVISAFTGKTAKELLNEPSRKNRH